MENWLSVISKIIKYSSPLVPTLQENITILMSLRLGFNWSMGPFEMLENIGLNNFFSRIDDIKDNKFLNELKNKKISNFYDQRQKYTSIETLEKIKKNVIKLDKNDLAEIFRSKDFNIVEFNTTNALDYNSDSLIKFINL